MEMEREIQLADVARIDSDDTGEHTEDVKMKADSLLNSMKANLTSTSAKSSPSFTICRVPDHIRDSDRAAYSPSIISIGPFHRQSTNLQAMEEHKWRYLHNVLSRSKPENDLEKYLKEMKAIEAEARNCYSENIPIATDEFIEMMVVDGCFILGLIHEQNDYFDLKISDDPIYRNQWMMGRICHDMLLLENQLPFFVLELLWELIGGPKETLMEEALTFFCRAFPGMLELKCPDTLELKCPKQPDHILHLLHAVHLSRTVQQSFPESKPPSMAKMVPCAMQLQEAGFKFQRKKANSFLDVTFEKGLMKMPRLWIDGHTNVLFRNFIAFEQCFPKWGNHFTSYCCLIDALVNTAKDVSILTQSKIIEHLLGSDEEVAHLFNTLCKGVTCDYEHSYLANMFEEVNQHTQRRRPKWRAKLVPNYFSNPWAIIFLIAAIIIVIVFLVRTFFAVFAYFRPLKP